MTIFHSKKPYGSEKFFTEPYGSSTFHQFPGLCPELPDPLSRHVRIKVAHASRMGLNRLHTGPGYRPGIYVRVKIRLNNILPKVESIFLSIKELFISQFQETYTIPLDASSLYASSSPGTAYSLSPGLPEASRHSFITAAFSSHI